jgi:hypothetical protein
MAPGTNPEATHRNGQSTESDQASIEDYASELANDARALGQERSLNVTTADDWNSRAWDAIVHFVDQGLEWDVDEIRAIIGPPPSVGAPGAIIKRAAAAGLIRSIGFCRSRTLQRRGGLQLRWGTA